MICLKLVIEMNIYCVCMFVNCFKRFLWGYERTLQMIQGMGGYQMLELQKQLQKACELVGRDH
jgi:hypothetical protein